MFTPNKRFDYKAISILEDTAKKFDLEKDSMITETSSFGDSYYLIESGDFYVKEHQIEIIQKLLTSNIEFEKIINKRISVDHEWSGHFDRNSGTIRVRKYSGKESFLIRNFYINVQYDHARDRNFVDAKIAVESLQGHGEVGHFSIDYFSEEFYDKLIKKFSKPVKEIKKRINKSISKRYGGAGAWA